MRNIFMLLVCAVLVAAFVNIGICADISKAKDKKMSVMDKINKKYNDFRNRDKAVKTQIASPSIAEKEPVRPKEITPEPVKKELTKEDMIAGMKNDFGTYDEILDLMPGIKAQKDKEGNVSYTYNGIKIEEISKEDLQLLSTRVRQMAIKLRTERIQKQLETVNRAQAAANVAGGGAATPSAPPVPPRIPQVSSVPHAPQSAPSTPKAPPAPSLPSQRR